MSQMIVIQVVQKINASLIKIHKHALNANKTIF